MSPTISFQTAELTAPTAELRSAFAEMRREIEIMRRREDIREAELRRLAVELERASRLQRQLITSPLPAIHGAELSAFAHPAESVSGDFHHVRRISADTVALLVADATGHGLAAGILSAAVMGSMHAQTELQAQGRGGPVAHPGGSAACSSGSDRLDPAEVLARIHRNVLSYTLDDCEFVTAVYAEYDETRRTLRWSRAGAPPPILVRRGVRARRLNSAGLALGVEAEAVYSTAEIQLEPGDTILLHTDGIEALHNQCMNSRDEQDFLGWIERLSETGLQSSLREVADRCAQIGQCGERDDMTLLELNVSVSAGTAHPTRPT